MAGARLAALRGGLLAAFACGQPLLDRIEAAGDRAQLGLQLADVLGGRGAAALDRPGHRRAPARDAAPRRPAQLLDRPGQSSSAPWAPLAAALGRAERGLHGALDRLAQVAGSSAGSRRAMASVFHTRRPVFRVAAARSSTTIRAIHLKPTAELAERVLLPGDPHRALAVAQRLLEGPRMFNHTRGLWGYTGIAADGEPLTDPVHRHGRPERRDRVRGADRAGRQAARPDRHLRRARRRAALGALVAAEPVLPADGASAALGADGRARAGPGAARTRWSPPARAPATVVEHRPLLRPARREPRRWVEQGAAAVEMETAAILGVAARRGAEAGGCVLGVTDVPGRATRGDARERGARGDRRCGSARRLRGAQDVA